MRVDVLTIFPQLISDYCQVSIVGRAWSTGALDLRVHDLRAYTHDVHRSVDDSPFGGGAGMLMSCAPIFEALETVKPPRPLIMTAPHGRRLDQRLVEELSGLDDGFSVLCGRYEGIDARVEAKVVDEVVSLGDFVLAGGEIAALAIVEATARLLPGVLGNSSSVLAESFQGGLLEYEQYTRPASYEGMSVPDVLLSGNHAEIARFQRQSSLLRTAKHRPEMILELGGLSQADADLLRERGYSYLVDKVSRSSEDNALN